MQAPLKTITLLDAQHIPTHLHDACLAIDEEFPLHYDTAIVRVPDDGNLFSEWLKTLGFTFTHQDKYPANLKISKKQRAALEVKYDYIAVRGT